jgi:DNA-binding NarL/FixJ family response regulator
MRPALQDDSSGHRSGPESDKTPGSPIKVLIVDDHPVVRKGLSSCFAGQEDLVTAGEAADGHEALARAKELSPDVVLMDIDLPKLDGLSATEALRRENPNIRVLLVSMHSAKRYGVRIFQSGACGFIPKGAPAEDFVRAVKTVAAGQSFFGPDIAQTALNHYVANQLQGRTISARERQVLIEIAMGSNNTEMAARLGIGIRTIQTHRERLMRKLNIHTVAGLTRFAVQEGLVIPG